MPYFLIENWQISGMFIRKQSEGEGKKYKDGGKQENIGNKRKKLKNIANILGFANT